MAPKRPSAAALGSASDASEGRGRGPPPVLPVPLQDAAPNPNPKSAAPSSAPASASVAADSAAAGSDSGGAYDSDADAGHRPAPKAASPKPGGGDPKPPSPDVNSDSNNSAAPAASDADPAAGADSEDDNASPLPPLRPSRAEAATIKPISSRPMDPPRRSAAASEPRAKRPRSAAVGVASSAEQMKRPSRLWSQGDELVILRGLIVYRAKRGTLPGSTLDIGKLHGHIRSQLSVKVSTTQLSDKVRRLKQKYQLLATRAKKGRDQDLPTPHDHSIYELAKRVWGTRSGGGGDGGGGYENAAGGESEEEQDSGGSDDDMENGRDDRDRKNRRLRPVTMANGNGIGIGPAGANGRGKSEFEKGKDAYPYLWETVEELSREHPSGTAFKKAFEVLEGSRARVMEEKLRKFRLTEIRQQLHRMDLMKETVKMVLDALERAD